MLGNVTSPVSVPQIERRQQRRRETSLKQQDNISTETSFCFLAGNQFVLEIKCFPGVEEVRVWTQN